MINKCKITPIKTYCLHLIPIFLFSFSILFTSCNTPKNEKETKKKEHIKKEKKAITFPKLNTENVASFLLSYGETTGEDHVKIITNMGEITVHLFDETPIHRANFIMLAKRKYYDESLFYRVIKDFMIQGGASDDTKFRGKQRQIGKYKLPHELKPNLYHKRGTLSMARMYKDNPQKLSDSYEFFIVEGIKYNQAQLDVLTKEDGKNFNTIQTKSYIEEGGAPHLDMEHTVFGEVITGMEVIEKIANVKVNAEDNWPIEEVKILKMIPFKR